jgi:hypothetical protein
MNNTLRYAFGALGGSILSAIVVVLSAGRPSLLVLFGFFLCVGSLAGVVKLLGVDRLIRLLSAFGSAPQHTVVPSRLSASAPKLRRVKSDSDRWEEVLQGKRMPGARADRRAVKESEENAAFFSDPELFEVPAKKGQVA